MLPRSFHTLTYFRTPAVGLWSRRSPSCSPASSPSSSVIHEEEGLAFDSVQVHARPFLHQQVAASQWSALCSSIQEVVGLSPRRGTLFCSVLLFLLHTPQPHGPNPHLGRCTVLLRARAYFFTSLCILAFFQCILIYRKCPCFELLITKYACIQIKQTIYVKCLEFYLVSQYATFIHV